MYFIQHPCRIWDYVTSRCLNSGVPHIPVVIHVYIVSEVSHFGFCSPRSLELEISDLDNTVQHLQKNLGKKYRLRNIRSVPGLLTSY